MEWKIITREILEQFIRKQNYSHQDKTCGLFSECLKNLLILVNK